MKRKSSQTDIYQAAAVENAQKKQRNNRYAKLWAPELQENPLLESLLASIDTNTDIGKDVVLLADKLNNHGLFKAENVDHLKNLLAEPNRLRTFCAIIDKLSACLDQHNIDVIMNLDCSELVELNQKLQPIFDRYSSVSQSNFNQSIQELRPKTPMNSSPLSLQFAQVVLSPPPVIYTPIARRII